MRRRHAGIITRIMNGDGNHQAVRRCPAGRVPKRICTQKYTGGTYGATGNGHSSLSRAQARNSHYGDQPPPLLSPVVCGSAQQQAQLSGADSHLRECSPSDSPSRGYNATALRLQPHSDVCRQSPVEVLRGPMALIVTRSLGNDMYHC